MGLNKNTKVAILGGGNIGTSIAKGLVFSKQFRPEQIFLTRRNVHLLDEYAKQGFGVMAENQKAVEEAHFVFLCVEPQQIDALLAEIAPVLKPERHIVISVVSGVGFREIGKRLDKKIRMVRAMPNLAISIGESMTCLAFQKDTDLETIEEVKSLFMPLGKVMVIDEEQMIAATILAACGIAFFLRAIRAASQGGIEIGFHSQDALTIAAQTAKGAAALLLVSNHHPEWEIDRVTTPRGCTISGLNQMEHEGFSSAMIKGILTSREKAEKLYPGIDP